MTRRSFCCWLYDMTATGELGHLALRQLFNDRVRMPAVYFLEAFRLLLSASPFSTFNACDSA
jgi:hypothetical protein